MGVLISNAFQGISAVVSAGAFARLVNFPSGVTRARVGVRIGTTGTTTVPGANTLFLGFCKGTTNIMGDATVDQFVGVTNPGTWTYGAGFYATGINLLNPCKKVGATLTNSLNWNFGGGTPSIQGGASGNAQALFFEAAIVDATTLNCYTFTAYNSVAAPMTNAQFLNAMQQPTPTFTQYLWTSTPVTVTIADTSTFFTNCAANFYWQDATVTMQICDIAVSVLG